MNGALKVQWLPIIIAVAVPTVGAGVGWGVISNRVDDNTGEIRDILSTMSENSNTFVPRMELHAQHTDFLNQVARIKEDHGGLQSSGSELRREIRELQRDIVRIGATSGRLRAPVMVHPKTEIYTPEQFP